MDFEKYNFSPADLLKFYELVLFPRLIEEKMLMLLRQGKISKWFSGIGQEAISVGCACALKNDEYILPLHRNLGIFTTRKVDLVRLFAQFLGKREGFTKGRDRSFHFGSREDHIIGMISHLGSQLSVANGIALARLYKKEKKVTLVFSGEGGTSEGEFHEALNIASVWRLPVIFLIENNGYALSTPLVEQVREEDFVKKGAGYGVRSYAVDGNNILEVVSTVDTIAKELRKKPDCVLIEAKTFRIRGHEEASGVKYVPPDLIESWQRRDPVKLFENYLSEKGILNEKKIDQARSKYDAMISDAWNEAVNYKEISPNQNTEINDVFSPVVQAKEKGGKATKTSELRYIDAISTALDQALDSDENIILMGQDIAEYGGAFKVTEGLVSKYGRHRIKNTPLCESAIVGMGLGLSIEGIKSVIEMQFADFVSCAFNQIVNNLAKSYYRWQQNADVVIRMPTGAGLGAGPYHSQSTEAWFFHVPGLKIVYPSNPYDAKGLLISAIEDPNPVLYFEHKFLYRSLKGMVPTEIYRVPIGKAAIVKEGADLTIISYGLAVHWALKAIEEMNVAEVEVIDLRSLTPWDQETVYQSVRKTNKVLIIHEDTLTGGIGAEISASITENCFEYLDAPVKRMAALDTPVPFNKTLENDFLPVNRIKKGMEEMLNY